MFARILFSALFALAVLLPVADGKAQAGYALYPDDQKLSSFVRGYADKREPRMALSVLEALDLSAIKDPANLKAFYVLALEAATPDQIVASADRMRNRDNSAGLRFLAEAVFVSDHPERAAVLKALGLPEDLSADLSGLRRSPYAGMTIDDARSIDIAWAAYFGSGSEDYLGRIVAKLEHLKAGAVRGGVIDRLKPRAQAGDEDAKRELDQIILAEHAFKTLMQNASGSEGVRDRLLKLDKSGRITPEDARGPVVLILSVTER